MNSSFKGYKYAKYTIFKKLFSHFIRFYHKVLSPLCKLSASLPQNNINHLTDTLQIVNHLERLFHVSLIEPTYLWGFSQILQRCAKFLPQACSKRSHNIPSLGAGSLANLLQLQLQLQLNVYGYTIQSRVNFQFGVGLRIDLLWFLMFLKLYLK